MKYRQGAETAATNAKGPPTWDLDNDGQSEIAVAYGKTLNIFDLLAPFQSNDLHWFFC